MRMEGLWAHCKFAAQPPHWKTGPHAAAQMAEIVPAQAETMHNYTCAGDHLTTTTIQPHHLDFGNKEKVRWKHRSDQRHRGHGKGIEGHIGYQ